MKEIYNDFTQRISGIEFQTSKFGAKKRKKMVVEMGILGDFL